MKKNINKTETALLNVIVEAVQEKKGKEIVIIDLRDLDHSICDYFIVCHGDSTTQVGAIARCIQEMTEKKAGIRPRNIEGAQNAQWILVDFFNIIVHVFQKEIRTFYQLEELWSDGKLQVIKEL